MGGRCRICGMIENLEHLFFKCKRLKGVFDLLKRWFQAFDEELSGVFIWGVMYRFVMRRKACLLNYLTGTVTLAIWKTRKNEGPQLFSTDAALMFKVKYRICVL